MQITSRIIKGILSLIPILVIIGLFGYFFEIVENIILFVSGYTNNNSVITLSIFIITILILYYLGYLLDKNKKFILIKITEKIIEKIPIVKSIYSIVEELIKMFSPKKNSDYLGVVYVKFGACKVIGFVTNKDEKKDILTVFVPTTPNPTSGLLLFLKEEDVEFIDMEAKEVFTLLLSLGVKK